MAKFVPVERSKQKARFVPVEERGPDMVVGGGPTGRGQRVNLSEMQRQREGTGVGGAAVGMGETALQTLTGVLGQTAGGFTGIGSLAYSAVTGETDALETAVNRINSVSDALTYDPRTESGRLTSEMMANDPSLRSLQRGAETAGRAAADVAGPAAGAGTQTAVEFLPSLFGVRRPGSLTPRERSADIAAARQQAESVGVDIGSQKSLIETSARAGREMVGSTARSDSMEAIQKAIQSAKEQQKQLVNQLYSEARGTSASIPGQQVRELTDSVQQSLRSFDVEDMPIVRRRVNEMRKFEALPDDSAVKLNAISEFRQRLNRNRPPKGDVTQDAALNVMKGQLDEWLTTQFNSDMIKGDAAALTKWREATNASRRYKEMFKDNKVIRQMAEQEATPEMMRAWVFNTSRVGLKRQATDVVRRLKRIVGEDSPEFKALQQDAMLDVIDPLLDSPPRFRDFNKNFDNYVKNNPTLVKELFPNSGQELRSLRNMTKAIDEKQVQKVLPNIEKGMEKFVVAHTVGGKAAGLAKGYAKMNMGGQIFNVLKKVAQKKQRRQILGEILGYDPGQPLLPKSPVIISGGIQEALQGQEEKQE